MLAIDGGEKVRKTGFPGHGFGSCLIGPEEEKEILDVIRAQSPFRYYGAKVQNKTLGFEELLAQFLGVKHALGLNSGTSALMAAIQAAGIGPGDEVLVPAVTFIATVNNKNSGTGFQPVNTLP